MVKNKNPKKNTPQEIFKNNKFNEVNLNTLELKNLIVENDTMSQALFDKDMLQDKKLVKFIEKIVQKEVVKWCDKNLAKFVKKLSNE